MMTSRVLSFDDLPKRRQQASTPPAKQLLDEAGRRQLYTALSLITSMIGRSDNFCWRRTLRVFTRLRFPSDFERRLSNTPPEEPHRLLRFTHFKVLSADEWPSP